MPSLIKIVQAIKKLNSISRARWNFRRRPILCTTLYRNLMQSEQLWWHMWPIFSLNFFMKFSQRMPLYFFYTMVQKSQKWPKTQIKGMGPALKEKKSNLWKMSVQKSIFSFSSANQAGVPVYSHASSHPESRVVDNTHAINHIPDLPWYPEREKNSKHSWSC